MLKLTLAQLRVYAREEKKGVDGMTFDETMSFIQKRRAELGLPIQ